MRFFQHIRQSVGIDRCEDQDADPLFEHHLDLLLLPADAERRIPQNDPVPFRLHAVADLLIEDLIEFIIHGHVTCADQIGSLFLIGGDIRPEKQVSRKDQDTCPYEQCHDRLVH